VFVKYRNDWRDNRYIKHSKIDRRLQTGVGKQQSLCSLRTSSQSPATQRRMSKQWSMPSSSSINCVESAVGVGGSGHCKDSRTTLSKSSSCRSATGSVTRRAPCSSTEITIDVADADDDVTSQPAAAAVRRPVMRNSSLTNDRQMLDVYYDMEHR